MTQTIKNVWIYSDSQASMETAAATALEVAKQHDATLTILSVVESTDPILETSAGRELLTLIRDDKQEATRWVAERANRELPPGRVVTTALEGDVAWHVLTRHAIRHSPDLLIVPADGGATAGPFGTLSQHLFRECPAPVWSVQATASGLPKLALVAVAPGADGSDDRILSREILRVATGIASNTTMQLDLGHAWTLLGEELLAAKKYETEPLLEVQRQIARDMSEQLIEQAGCREQISTVHFPRGDPGKAIPKLAEKLGAGVVILGSAARRGLEGFFIGSVAETILSRLGSSALVVKPPGFVSPVRVL